MSEREVQRLNKKYGKLLRADSITPNYYMAHEWPEPETQYDSTVSKSESESESESDGGSGLPTYDYENEIFALLDMAKMVKVQKDKIDVLQMRLEAAEARARSAESALARAAERCADAVDEALAPGVRRKRVRRMLANIDSWVILG